MPSRRRRLRKREQDAECSFCTLPKKYTAKLIAAPDERAHICDACIRLCSSILEYEERTAKDVGGH